MGWFDPPHHKNIILYIIYYLFIIIEEEKVGYNKKLGWSLKFYWIVDTAYVPYKLLWVPTSSFFVCLF